MPKLLPLTEDRALDLLTRAVRASLDSGLLPGPAGRRAVAMARAVRGFVEAEERGLGLAALEQLEALAAGEEDAALAAMLMRRCSHVRTRLRWPAAGKV